VTLRVVVVAITCAVASVFSDISKFSSLVGALLVSFAGFVLPPIIHMKLLRDEGLINAGNCGVVFVDVALMLFGTATCIIGTTSAVQNILAPVAGNTSLV
jgi:hypothetical protein